MEADTEQIEFRHDDSGLCNLWEFGVEWRWGRQRG